MGAAPETWSAKLTRAEELRGLAVLLANQTLLNGSFFMLFPLISVHYTRDVGMSATVIGIVLAVRQLSQQGPMIFGGALAERIGYKRAIAVGLLVRGIGLSLIAFAVDLPLLLTGAIVFGLGGALGEATALAALAAITAPEARPRRYSLAATFGGTGAAVGPLLGVYLLGFDFTYVSLAAAACCFLGCVLTGLLMPTIEGAGSGAPRLAKTVQTVWRDRPFVLFTALMIGYWFLFAQLFITVPLHAAFVTGGPDAIGILYAVNSATLISLNYLVVRWVSRRLAPLTILQIGLVLIGLGLGSYSFAAALPALVVGILVNAFGRMLAEPMIQTITAQVAVERARAAYFGFGLLALGIGGSTGQLVGGWLFDLGQTFDRPALPWIACALVALSVVLGLGVLRLGAAGRRLVRAA